jgi:hypothetical protein
MANSYTGIGILFGFPGGPTGTLTGVAIGNVQSLDFTRKSQKEQTKDGNGNTAGVAYYDHEDSATIDFVFSGSTTAIGNTTMLETAVPTPGALATLTDTSFTALTKTLLVDEFSVTRGNTKAMMAKVSLSRYINNSLPS